MKKPSKLRSLGISVLLIGILALFWLLAWEHITPVSVILAIGFSVLVTRLLYLPPVDFSGRFNLVYFVAFVLWFTWHVVTASISVAFKAFKPRAPGAGSVVAVQLHTRSDLLITVISQVSGLIPGSLVVEADRARSIIYLHGLDCSNDAAVERVRHDAHRIEYFLIGTMGSPHDISVFNEYRREKGLKPVVERRSLEERRRASLRKKAEHRAGTDRRHSDTDAGGRP